MLQPLTSDSILLLNLKIYNSLYYEHDHPKYARYPAAANVLYVFT